MTDNPAEKHIEIQESTGTSDKAGGESTIQNTDRQSTWQDANALVHKDDQNPSEVKGIKAVSSFGIDFGDGSVLTAKGLDKVGSPRAGEKFLENSLSDDKLRQISEKVKLSPEKVKELREEFEANAQEPVETLCNRMKQNKVLGIGEFHGIKGRKNEGRDFGVTIMSKLKESGATHLALELPVSFQGRLDEFARTGKLEASEIPGYDYKGDYLPLLKAAREAGLKILAVDSDDAGKTSTDIRNKHMASVLQPVLSNPNSKVVAWIGAQHFEGSETDSGESLAELLRKTGHKTATVFPELPANDYTLGRIVPDLNRSTIINTERADGIGALKIYGPAEGLSFLSDRYSWWDEVLVFPAAPKKK